MGDSKKVPETEKGKIIFLTAETVEFVLKAANTINNLSVINTDVTAPKLTKGEGKSILELPRTLAGASGDHPFKIVKVDETTIRVIQGFVNGIPAKMNGVLNQTTPPQTLTINQTCFVYLAIDFIDSDSFTEVANVNIYTAATTPNSTSLTAFYPIGEVQIENGILTTFQNVKGSLFCLRSHCDPQVTPVYMFQGV